jgi:hypothetical protein
LKYLKFLIFGAYFIFKRCSFSWQS